jgi:hypothetical protein
VLACGIVLGALIGVRILILERRQNKEEAHKNAIEGELKPKKGTQKKRDVTLCLGSNKIAVQTSLIANGYMYRPLHFIGIEIPFLVKVINGKILIDAEFRSLDDSYVATIKNNNWTLSKFNHHKKEFNDNKLEVVDNQGITKLQIDFSDEFNIKLSGVVYDGTNIYFIYPDGGVSSSTMQPANKQDEPHFMSRKEAIEKSRGMPELFPSIIPD